MRHALLAVLLAIVLMPFALTEPEESPAGVRWFSGSFDEALEQARTQNKLILVDCWATWCTFCHVMDAELWSRADVARSLKHDLIPVRKEVDVHRRIGLDFGERFNVEDLPVVLILSPQGKEVSRITGMASAKQIVDAVELARDRAGLGSQNLSAEQRVTLASRALLAERFDEAAAAARKLLAEDQSCEKDLADDAVVIAARALLQLSHKQQKGEQTRDEALALLARVAPVCSTADSIEEVWAVWIEAQRSIDAGRSLGRLLERRARLRSTNPINAIEYAEWVVDDSHDFADNATRDRAMVWLKRHLTTQSEDTALLSLIARLQSSLGKRQEALSAIDAAIEIDPHDPDLRELRLKILRSKVSR